jgi:hypothetical protein
MQFYIENCVDKVARYLAADAMMSEAHALQVHFQLMLQHSSFFVNGSVLTA